MWLYDTLSELEPVQVNWFKSYISHLNNNIFTWTFNILFVINALSDIWVFTVCIVGGWCVFDMTLLSPWAAAILAEGWLEGHRMFSHIGQEVCHGNDGSHIEFVSHIHYLYFIFTLVHYFSYRWSLGRWLSEPRLILDAHTADVGKASL